MRGPLLLLLVQGPALSAVAALAALAAGCDKSGPLAELDAGSTWVVAPSASADAGPSTASSPPVDAGRVMPPRPVPTTNPTVRITMPVDIQLQAIQYMAAMQAPQPNDPPVDPTYAKDLADKLRAVGRTDVVSSGRRIDIFPPRCDANLPREAVTRHSGAMLTTLLAHGVLVVRCADKELQCLQSTRDPDDVLCTHK
jgi:hypothetical protein